MSLISPHLKTEETADPDWVQVEQIICRCQFEKTITKRKVVNKALFTAFQYAGKEIFL